MAKGIVGVRLEDDVREAVERAAAHDRRSLSEWVRIAVERALHDDPPPPAVGDGERLDVLNVIEARAVAILRRLEQRSPGALAAVIDLAGLMIATPESDHYVADFRDLLKAGCETGAVGGAPPPASEAPQRGRTRRPRAPRR